MIQSGGPASPLGVRHAIARWFDGAALRNASAPADARVIAPRYTPPTRSLGKAEEEASFVRTRARRAHPARDADRDPHVLEALARNAAALRLPRAGRHPAGVAARQRRDLVRAARVGHARASGHWGETAPIVFLNACDVGRPAPALSGAGGLVRAWIDAGAGAVIAPLWSVRDEIAHDVALRFYNRMVAEPRTSYAEIVRDIRSLAYVDGEDTYAAYCYFGSPRAEPR